MNGVGGPDEPVADAAPATTYRACSPGPGDDNCIQLYEPGVRESLASWEASRMSGQQVAMGGPDDPVETGVADEHEMAEDAAIEAAAYEPLPEDAVMPASDELAKTELPADGPDTTTAI